MRWFLMLGGLGLAGFVVEFVDDRFPDALLLLAFVSCVVSLYGVLILRGRARGDSVIESLEIRYGPRLTKFERSFSLILGAGLIALNLPSLRSPISWVTMLAGAYAIYHGVTGRPPIRTVRADPESGGSDKRSGAETPSNDGWC